MFFPWPHVTLAVGSVPILQRAVDEKDMYNGYTCRYAYENVKDANAPVVWVDNWEQLPSVLDALAREPPEQTYKRRCVIFVIVMYQSTSHQSISINASRPISLQAGRHALVYALQRRHALPVSHKSQFAQVTLIIICNKKKQKKSCTNNNVLVRFSFFIKNSQRRLNSADLLHQCYA